VQYKSIDEVHNQFLPWRLLCPVVEVTQPNVLYPLMVIHLLPSLPVVQRLENHRELSARWYLLLHYVLLRDSTQNKSGFLFYLMVAGAADFYLYWGWWLNLHVCISHCHLCRRHRLSLSPDGVCKIPI
jgi:hypothetical protein